MASNPKDYGIPYRLKNIRQKRSLTQAELAKLAGISQSALAQFESGTVSPTVKTLILLSEALETSPAVFFTSDKDEVLVFDLGVWKKRGYKKLEDLPDLLHRNLVTIYLTAKKMGMG